MTRTDVVLLLAIAIAVAVGVALRPLRPFLLVPHPLLLTFLDGGLVSIAAAASLASIGQLPTASVVIVGVLGMAKFDWLTWWAGRRWGRGLLAWFMPSARAERWTARAERAPRWAVMLAVVGSSIPGIPSALICICAGWAGMRLRTFLALDLLGALLSTASIVTVGVLLGRPAVNAVLFIDQHAGVISLGLLAAAALTPLLKNISRRLLGAGTSRCPR